MILQHQPIHLKLNRYSKAINDWGIQTQINNFNSTFRAQQFEKAITLSDKFYH